MTIRIVTDSASDLPGELINSLGITVIPIFINIGDKGYLDGIEISRTEFYSNLPTYKSHPTTGTPGMEQFTSVYRELAEKGADQILSIHVSRKLSSLIEIAQTAAGDFQQIPVFVRDSQQLSAGVGFQVETAARMARSGEKMDEIIKALDDLAGRTIVAAKLDTLKYLRRSGRMNPFMSGLGSLLQIKPILTMKDGLPASERVRTSIRSYSRLENILKQHLPFERFSILHSNAAAEAEAFRARVAHLIPAGKTYSLEITPVLGAHLGPGAVGFAGVTEK